MFYFALTQRLQEIYRSTILVSLMTTWLKNGVDDGVMKGLADSQVWDEVFHAEWLHISKDPRHVWLGLATNGVHPFGHQTTSHSTWPVMLVVYNLEPWRSVHCRHIILNAIIPDTFMHA
jgi:hypothetical protein